jgi:hypothetical protein
VKIQDFDNADLAIIAITILGTVASVAMLVSGAGLEAVITGCVTAIAGIARSDKDKGSSDNAQ